ncbi:MAG: PEP-CTERM sorting domain-containing protein [Leptolyngbya sp. PLA1]|nr:PEP-CTERM sorting domain-containing protein [Leptolyngbya sp. PLA1]
MKKILVLAMLASASAAQAQLWVEIPDAPAALPFTAQMTVGVGPLLTISGGPDFPGDTVDAYCIHIYDVGAFSASTVGGTGMDSQLWLFRPDGTGVTFNDDAGPLQSTITGAFVPGPGLYILAVSAYDTDPVNAAGAALWLDTPFAVERAPDGPGAATPVAGWTAGPDLAPYRISLTGATYCEVPAPGALALLGLGGLVAARRRR